MASPNKGIFAMYVLIFGINIIKKFVIAKNRHSTKPEINTRHLLQINPPDTK